MSRWKQSTHDRGDQGPTHLVRVFKDPTFRPGEQGHHIFTGDPIFFQGIRVTHILSGISRTPYFYRGIRVTHILSGVNRDTHILSG